MPDKIYNIIKKASMWQWLIVCIVISELLTFSVSFITSHILWKKMSDEVLIIGIIDSFFVSFIIVAVLLMFIHKIRELYGKLENQNRELSFAISEIKTLQGILPICSYCKQIRNDNGYYEQIDDYIQKHSGVDFSHTICPRCLKEHYPEEYERIVSKGGKKD